MGTPKFDPAKPTAGQSIRLMCLHCLGVTNGRGAYDCLNMSCALYPAHPFRDRPVSKASTYNEPPSETARAVVAHAECPQKRASKRIIAEHCRKCNTETIADCGKQECPLFYWRPMQAGGQPKRRKLSRIGLLAAQANATLMTMNRDGNKLPAKAKKMGDILMSGD